MKSQKTQEDIWSRYLESDSLELSNSNTLLEIRSVLHQHWTALIFIETRKYEDTENDKAMYADAIEHIRAIFEEMIGRGLKDEEFDELRLYAKNHGEAITENLSGKLIVH